MVWLRLSKAKMQKAAAATRKSQIELAKARDEGQKRIADAEKRAMHER